MPFFALLLARLWLAPPVDKPPGGCDIRRRGGRIAQLAEQLTLNQRVPGSSPGAPTNEINGLAIIALGHFSLIYKLGNA